MTTTRKPSVLGVRGCLLASRTAYPRVCSALVPFIWVLCSAISDRVWRTIVPWSNPGLSTSHTCVPSGRGSTVRSVPSTHGPEDSTPRDVNPHVSAHYIPAAPPRRTGSRTRPPPTPGTKGTSARCRPGRGRGDWTAQGDHPRSWGRSMAIYPSSRPFRTYFNPPGRYQQRARADLRIVLGFLRPSCGPSVRG